MNGVDAGCEEMERNISFRLIEGSNRYKKEEVMVGLLEDIDAFGAKCDSRHAAYLRMTARYVFGELSVSECLRLVDKIVDSQYANPRTRVAALNMKARLTLKQLPTKQNYAVRQKALDLAESNKLRNQRLVVLTNWAFAAHFLGEMSRAEELVKSVVSELSGIPQVDVDKDPFLLQVAARIAAHSGKTVLAKAKSEGTDLFAAVQKANSHYETGVRRVVVFDHLRVNLLTEWAQELADAFVSSQCIEHLEEAVERLRQAHAGLDAHNCLLCRAYYCYVSARIFLARADWERKYSLTSALSELCFAKTECEESIANYHERGHPYIKEAESLLRDIEYMNEKLNRPRKVFLSHKSADKPLVRQFKNILELLRYEPWMDEDALPAGLLLERALSQGFKDSCAVVFFVTPEFRDENYLATEIEYALREKRKKMMNLRS